jgi:hypothetical protein
VKVEAFSYFSVDDPVDWQFDCPICWSRIYEYPFAIHNLRGSVHNTSWGYEGIHVVFRDWLNANVPDVVHSDMLNSGGEVWNVTHPPRGEWLGRFDTLLSISTLEEVRGHHVDIVERNFLPQLKPGGRAVITFDALGFQLRQVEGWLGREIDRPERILTPRNSPRPDVTWGLNDYYWVGYLILEV